MKFGLKITTYKCQISRGYLAYMSLTFMLKDGKSSYTPMRENSDTNKKAAG